jgi:hypothetical protein
MQEKTMTEAAPSPDHILEELLPGEVADDHIAARVDEVHVRDPRAHHADVVVHV